MDIKMVVIATVLVVLVLALVFTMGGPAPPVKPKVTSTTKTEETILSDQINSLTEEQLAAISIEVSDFSAESKDSIASDTSLFLY